MSRSHDIASDYAAFVAPYQRRMRRIVVARFLYALIAVCVFVAGGLFVGSVVGAAAHWNDVHHRERDLTASLERKYDSTKDAQLRDARRAIAIKNWIIGGYVFSFLLHPIAFKVISLCKSGTEKAMIEKSMKVFPSDSLAREQLFRLMEREHSWVGRPLDTHLYRTLQREYS